MQINRNDSNEEDLPVKSVQQVLEGETEGAENESIRERSWREIEGERLPKAK